MSNFPPENIANPWDSPSPGAQDTPREIAREWDTGIADQPGGKSARERIHRYRPTLIKKILSLVSASFGLILFLTNLAAGVEGSVVESLRTIIGATLLSVMVALPGSYWLWRNSVDKRTITKWLEDRASEDSLRQILGGDELKLLGTESSLPMLPRRRWGLLILAVIVLLIAGGATVP